MRYTLRDDGYAWLVIYHGRKSVGRVYAIKGKGYGGCIGKEHYGPYSSKELAFAETVAQHLGYPNARALNARMNVVAARNREVRRDARHVVNQMMSRDPAVRNAGFDALFDRLGAPPKRGA